MNIPAHVARAQGAHGSKGAAHGVKGAVHGSKGGRPRLDLTDEERKEHRRKQQEAWRRRNGVSPKKVQPPSECQKSWMQQYLDIWGKSPEEPLTPEEFAKREPIWNARVLKQQEADKRQEAEKKQRKLERQKRREERQRSVPPPAPVAAPLSVGRNQPCPCGSGRKFKKCCGP